MNKKQLFAKIACKNDKHKIVFTSKEDIEKIAFFDVPDIDMDKTLEFSTENEGNIEEDEWFFIELDEEHKNMLLPYTENVNNTADMNPITAEDYMSVEAIYKIINDEQKTIRIVFQKIMKSSKIENKHFLSFGEHPEICEQKNSIEIANRQDAYFNGYNRIYFKKFSSIRSFFDGIEDYYREATNDEVQKIKKCELIEICNDIKIGIRNLKKIATILNDENIKLDDKAFQNKLKDYADKYPEAGLKLNNNGKFDISNDKELGAFLSLASGRYYTSEMTGDKMEAHTTKKLKGSKK